MKKLNNVIEKVHYTNLYNHASSFDTRWRYVDFVVDDVDTKNYYFVSLIFEKYILQDPVGFELCKPIFSALKKEENHDIVVQRVKLNLYPSSQKLIEHAQHIDGKRGNACVYMLNDCDGWTKVINDKCLSVANTAVLFKSNVLHNSTNCTDKKVRLTININYI